MDQYLRDAVRHFASFPHLSYLDICIFFICLRGRSVVLLTYYEQQPAHHFQFLLMLSVLVQ